MPSSAQSVKPSLLELVRQCLEVTGPLEHVL